MKQKTRKSVAKKVKVSGSKKVIRRHSGQNHYNAKETGKFKRKKRAEQTLTKTDQKNVLKALPYA